MIKSIKLNPIQRVHGGPVLVSVEVEFLNGTIISSLACTDSANESDILDARKRAIDNAKKEYGFTVAGQDFLRGAYMSLIDANKESVQAEALKDKDYAETIEKLNKPALPRQAEEVKRLCDVLGLALIDVTNMTILQAQTLLAEMNRHVKRYEVQVDTSMVSKNV